ncbi:MAG: endolytic transglycosylase MltG [Patescibacteria group bacterium]
MSDEPVLIENSIVENQPQRRRFFFIISGILGLLIVALAVFGVFAWWQIACPPGIQAGEKIFLVEKGQGVKEIAVRLEAAELIKSAWWFGVYIWFSGKETNLQAGKYDLGGGLTVPEIASLITGGQVIKNEVQATLPEGFTLAQISERLKSLGLATEEIDQEATANYQVQYKFLSDAPAGAGLEGFLFPDTYIFDRDDKASAIIKKFLDNFDKKLTPDLREQISKQDKKIYDIIILASIIQQEAIGEEDMPLVAGVFANRLRINMALESDATINYLTGKKDRQSLYEDLKIKSPYNTYLNRGLLPGPIANPGLAAIKAAISPATTDYLFFLHPLDGETVFRKTLSANNQKQAKYLK